MHKQAGFTLIEMLTVVLIIGVLTAVALPQYRRAIQKSRVTEAVAMLRVINDSAERLANEFGYRTFKSFSGSSSPDKAKANFQRMDMFNEDTIACTFGDSYTTMTCETFKYYLNKGGDYAYARKMGNPYKDIEIRLSRGDIAQVTCAKGGMSSVDAAKDACDVFNINWAN